MATSFLRPSTLRKVSVRLYFLEQLLEKRGGDWGDAGGTGSRAAQYRHAQYTDCLDCNKLYSVHHQCIVS